jgi:hypothetical protein
MSSFFDEASLVMIPSGYKNQKVYSVKPLDGSGDLTFSRASNATRVASNGLIEKVRTNLILQSNSFDTTWANSNSTETSGQAGYDGTNNAWLLTKSVDSGLISQNTSSTTNSTFSVYAKAADSNYILILSLGGSACYFDLVNGTVSSGTGGSIESIGNGWYRCSVFSSSAVTQQRIYPAENGSVSAATGSVLIQNAMMEAGDIATDYIPTTTAAVSVGPVSGLPRLDYLNSSCPRLLLEPQRTNLIPSSENITAASIQKLASGTGAAPVVTANQGTSPDGYVNADRVVFDIAGGTTASDVSRLFFTDGATPINASVYVKSSNGSSVYNMFLRCGNTTKQIIVTGQWQRFDVTEPSSGANWQLGLQGDYDNSSSASVLVWGAQLEAGAYATSYIPTLSTSVTRVADAASKTGISSLIGQTEGTLFFEFNILALGQQIGIITSVAGNEVNRLQVYVNDAGRIGLYRGDASVNILSPTSPLYTVGSTVKIAAAYKLNDFVLYVNGVQVGSDTSGTIPPTPSVFYLSQYVDGSASSGAHSQALIFKTRLSNSDLATLTTL